ncbi:acyl-CoA thioesterase domain-containing protein [Mycobacterium sp. E1747]|uniref:acyl-CoA thioesterase domain-containing protein n=1 Tax=Mycobacterium sp. E1747 TaxID=1834128 RepID=UPI0007FF27B2|nr:acyl-CoA thioesterase domain-containing protein [Mycobacterium sp. E1747]OBH12796.1 hypothetical protein A5695_15510 [Mycobacterium sp. E1747]
MRQDDRPPEIRPVSPTEILDRFLIRHEISPDAATVAMSMPVAGHVNPLNGAPTAAALTLLIDTVGGLVNHRLRGEGQWTVTSELAADLVPDAIDRVCRASSPPVIAAGRTIGARGATSLAVCTLTCAGRDIGVATVRSFFVDAVADLTPPKESLIRSDETTLAELLSATKVDSSPGFATPTLVQRHDPVLVNSLGVVNGGVSSACLILAAAAAVDAQAGTPMQLGSVRVNFLRPLRGSAVTHYAADIQRIGRQTAVATAYASNEGSRPELFGTLTGYGVPRQPATDRGLFDVAN